MALTTALDGDEARAPLGEFDEGLPELGLGEVGLPELSLGVDGDELRGVRGKDSDLVS